MKSLNKLSREIYQNAADHGWYDKKRSFGDIVALCHSEALEGYRTTGSGRRTSTSSPSSGKSTSTTRPVPTDTVARSYKTEVRYAEHDSRHV